MDPDLVSLFPCCVVFVQCCNTVLVFFFGIVV